MNPIAWDLKSSSRSFLHSQENWENALEELANYYRQWGTGKFAKYLALHWQNGQLQGIEHPDRIELKELVGYESQKEALVKNTEFLLAGYRALNVLLYGSRGSGKSSLVKGLLNRYYQKGLRLIEVSKSQLQDLPIIVESLREFPQKFIIFVDDLSFEDDDDAFKSLKVVLEGSVTAKAQNVVVYATSNRRHLVREFFSDRPRPSDSDEVHNWDTLQEKLSFSDRFGLTLTFEPANQDTYLEIVRHLAEQTQLKIKREDLEFRAKQWATRHNGRSGRTARQFIDFIAGEIALDGNS
jgi:predicted AAA+ superfamily ATPase